MSLFLQGVFFKALSLSTVHTISSSYQLPTMAGGTRRGRIGAPAVAIGTSDKEAKAQLSVEKKRKRYELEQAKKQKKLEDASCVLPSGDDRVSRSQALEISKLYAVPAAASETSPSPAPHPTQSRRTRQEKPSCTDYGSLRHALFNKPIPTFFFCGECDAWDNDKDIVPNIKQTSRRYKCVADHQSRIFPTTKLSSPSIRLEHPTRQVQALTEEEEVQDRRLGSGESTVNLEKAVSPPTEEVRGGEATRIIWDLSNKVTSLTRRIRYLEGTKTSVEEDARTPVEELPRSPAVKSGRKSAASENGRLQKEGTRVLDLFGIEIVVGERKDRARVGHASVRVL